MTAVDPALFTCPSCGAAYRWRPELSGRKAACATCHAVLRIPEAGGAPAALLAAPALSGSAGVTASPSAAASRAATPVVAPEVAAATLAATPAPTPVDPAPADADDLPVLDEATPDPQPEASPIQPPTDGTDLYDLNIDEPKEAPPPAQMVEVPEALNVGPGRCPNCGANLKPGAVLCLNCGYHVREGAKIETQVILAGSPEDTADEDHDEQPAPLVNARLIGDAAQQAEWARRDEKAREDRREWMRREIYVPLIVAALGVLVLIGTVLWVMPIEKPAAAPAGLTAALAALANASAGAGAGAPAAGGNPNAPAPAPGAPPGPAVVALPVVPTVPPPALQRVYASIRQAGYILLQIPFLFLGLLFVSRLFGTAFGPLFTGMLKLVAMAIAADAISFLAGSILLNLTEGLHAPGMYELHFLISYVGFWALAAYFFELDYREVFVLYVLSILFPVVLILVGITIFA